MAHVVVRVYSDANPCEVTRAWQGGVCSRQACKVAMRAQRQRQRGGGQV